MLEVIIAYLNGILTQYDFANEYYGLAERVEQGDNVFPGVYCGKDELKRIDFEREVLYHRQRSDINYSQNFTEGVSGCDDYVTKSYPLTLVAYVKRARQNDTNYSPSRYSESIAAAIKETPFGNLMAGLDAEDVQVEINNIITSAKTVWENEHENIEFAARHDHILISVEYTVTVAASQSCLKKWDCFETVTVTPPTIVISGRDWDSLPGKPVCLTADDLCELPMWNITSTDIAHWDLAYASIHAPVTIGNPANGLSLSGQQLSLGLASTNTIGALSSTDWNKFNNKQEALTFSTGLTNTSNTITNNLSTGIAGGQSVFGGVNAGENLTLNSTSHATKGKIFFGSASAYDGVNNRLGINVTSPEMALHVNGDILVGAFPNSSSRLRWANVSNSSNSAFMGQTANGFEVSPGSTSVFRVNIPGGAATFYFELYGNNPRLRVFRDGRVDYTPAQTATANNDHTWHFAGAGTARATAADTFYGVQVGQVLNAAANNQVIDALYVNTTFNNGAFTGITNNLLRLGGTGADVFTVRVGGEFAFKGGTVGLSQTGWGNMTNAVANQRTATYDRNTITLPELADIVNTLAADLRTKGILST